ncbi:MAG: hypothetical protein L3J39_08495 [Verrucomicrobiales bacterium]|nr:hypothetical protein [Verrucomicrobiales bacterium]
MSRRSLGEGGSGREASHLFIPSFQQPSSSPVFYQLAIYQPCHDSDLCMTLMILMTFASTITSAVGWWVGGFFGIEWAFILSIVASFYGIYLGWKINRDHFE